MDPVARRVAARFVKKAWDGSVLPLDDLDDMDEDERKEQLVDGLNRAADLLQALAEAFKGDLGSAHRDVAQAAKTIIQVSRRV